MTQHGLLLAILIVFGTGGYGCDGANEGPRRTAVAKEQLSSFITNMSKDEAVTPAEEYYVQQYTTAIHRLDSEAEGLGAPYLIVAAILRRSTSDGVTTSISLQWLEPGYTATGFYIESQDGTRTDFPNVFTWSDDDRRWYGDLLWRDTWVPLGIESEPASKDDRKSRWAQVRIGRSTIMNAANVGLILNDGSRSNAVPLFVTRTNDSSSGGLSDHPLTREGKGDEPTARGTGESRDESD